MLVLSVALAVRRLNDLNRTGWMALLFLVPLVNFVFMIYMMAASGTQGSNEYGPAPSANTTWVLVGAWAWVAVFGLSIIAAIAIPTLLAGFGMADMRY
jgi:hypothetical protein